MSDEKRAGMPPIPADYKSLLTEVQLMALHNVENFGWTLHFIRREGLDKPITVIKGSNGSTIGVIEEDGNLNMNPDIKVRD